MLTAINLDNQMRLKGDEIDDVTVKWNLASEFYARQTSILQLAPQECLSSGRLPAHGPGEVPMRLRWFVVMHPMPLSHGAILS